MPSVVMWSQRCAMTPRVEARESFNEAAKPSGRMEVAETTWDKSNSVPERDTGRIACTSLPYKSYRASIEASMTGNTSCATTPWQAC